MQIEREKHIGAEAYERCDGRNGQANGFKERTISTRLGQIAVSVPQVRNSSEAFRPQSLEAALLSEKALKVALAEMYVQGTSTRRVSAVLEALCGTQVSSTSVSRAVKELDEVLGAWCLVHGAWCMEKPSLRCVSVCATGRAVVQSAARRLGERCRRAGGKRGR